MTKSQRIRESAVIISSTVPSAKYSCSGSPLILAKGSTAIDGTLHSVHGTGEIGKNAVACGVEDPTAMRGDQAIDDDPVGGEGAKGTDLISAHETAVAFDIRCEDRRELSFDPVGFQVSVLPG